MSIFIKAKESENDLFTTYQDDQYGIVAYCVNRDDLKKIKENPIFKHTLCIYFLLGFDIANNKPAIYVGQTHGQAPCVRIDQHDNSIDEPYHNMWNRVLFVFHKDVWKKDRIDYLEEVFAKKIGDFENYTRFPKTHQSKEVSEQFDENRRKGQSDLYIGDLVTISKIVNFETEDKNRKLQGAYKVYLDEQVEKEKERIKNEAIKLGLNKRYANQILKQYEADQNATYSWVDEVVTGSDTVEKMVGLLFKEIDNIAVDMSINEKQKYYANLHFLDIAVKEEAEFLTAIRDELIDRRQKLEPYRTRASLKVDIQNHQLFGLAIRPETRDIAIGQMPGKREVQRIDEQGNSEIKLEDNIQCLSDYIPLLKSDKPYILDNGTSSEHSKIYDRIFSRLTKFNRVDGVFSDMTFDVVIGNPPYQERVFKKSSKQKQLEKSIGESSGNDSLSTQIFPLFCKLANEITNKYSCLIVPSRYFTSEGLGKCLIKYRQWLKENNHIKYLRHFSDAHEIFRNKEIKGGVHYYLADVGYNASINGTLLIQEDNTEKRINLFFNNSAEDIIIINPLNIAIVEQVTNIHNRNDHLDSKATGYNPFKISGEKSKLEDIVINSFVEDVWLRCKENVTFQIDRSFIPDKAIKLLDSWKVFISKSAGDPAEDKRVIGIPYIGGPGTACTDSLIAIGEFDNQIEAENLRKYIKTKFLRYLVSVVKGGQNTTSIVYQLVPMQNFTNTSDIDWSRPISDIDKQLYKKYKLDSLIVDTTTGQTASQYIEQTIAPME